MKISETILGARELIAGKDAWTQNYLARTISGAVCNPLYNKARKWCISGAIMATDEMRLMSCIFYIEKVLKKDFDHNCGVPIFNDTEGRTQLECVIVLERAAVMAINDGK